MIAIAVLAEDIYYLFLPPLLYLWLDILSVLLRILESSVCLG